MEKNLTSLSLYSDTSTSDKVVPYAFSKKADILGFISVSCVITGKITKEERSVVVGLLCGNVDYYFLLRLTLSPDF